MMSANDQHGSDRRGDRAAVDPAYSGGKVGTIDGGFAGASTGGLTSWFEESLAMSAGLARNWWAVALRGVCGIVFGIIALLMPSVTIGALVLWFAAYMLIDGIFAIVAGVRAATRHERWGALILEGLVDLIAAAIAFLAPIATIVAFVWLGAAWAIVSGGLMIAAAFRLRAMYGKGWLGFGGVVSVIWGILLFIAPITGAVVMTLWLGAYALVFGIAMLILSFRLKRRRHEPTSAMGQPA